MTTTSVAKATVVDAPVNDVAVAAASLLTPPPSVAPVAAVVDANTKKSLFAEEVKGFGVTPAPRPPASSTVSPVAPAASEPSTIAAQEAQPESIVDISVAPEAENTSTVAAEAPANNAALLGWD